MAEPKSAAPKRATKKTAAGKPTLKAVETTPPEPEAQEGAILKKRALVDRVAARSGIKKKLVKPVVEAVLAELGDALAAGQGMNLPPLGKVKIAKTKDVGQAKVHVARIRQSSSPAPQAKDPLAEPAE